MARRGRAKPRKIEPDPIYNNKVVTKLINRSMKEGKKSVAQKQVYGAFEIIKEKTKSDPIEVFSKAIDAIKPTMEVGPGVLGEPLIKSPCP